MIVASCPNVCATLRMISLVLCASLLYGCATVAGNSGVTPSPALAANHPLLGRIFGGKPARELTAAELYERMANAQVVYLGETHSNARHHELELTVLRALLENGKRPLIGFEFFSMDQTGYLMDFTVGANRTSEETLRQKLGWGKHRDKEWNDYFPLLRTAQEHKLSAFGADLPAGIVQRLTRVGRTGLSPVEKRFLHDTAFDNTAYHKLMQDTLVHAHCGWNDPVLIDRLYQTWLARNDAMATAIVDMVQAAHGQPVLVVLGSGHVRHNMGVFERVAYRLPGVQQVNLAFQETDTDRREPQAYFSGSPDLAAQFAPLHEYLWFTESGSEGDPCLRFKPSLQRKPDLP
ncbi:MAG: ChaN family lipoprotein [Gammaproteobacteria bacterium]